MHHTLKTVFRLSGLLACLSVGLAACAAPQLRVLLPLGRAAYQTNEQIDFAVVRSDTAALPAETLQLTVTDQVGSKLTFTYPLSAIAPANGEAGTTEHYRLSGWLLRPGLYTLQASAYGANAQTTFEVYSHLRKSSFRLVNWGRANDPKQIMALGEDGMGYNLYYAAYGGHDQNANIRSGIDYMGCCVMGGAHQMDMNPNKDWSDPLVINGGEARVARKALIDRTTPNTVGVHFYDEPGLTWLGGTPHNIPAQKRSFKGAFGTDPISYTTVKGGSADAVAQWKEWARWKLAFMDGAWKAAAFGVNHVRADYLTATQTEYGWMAFTDGIYFNSDRSLAVTSGHGGYDDYWLLSFNPVFFLEAGRAHNFTRPNWYLATWYGNTGTENAREEQYLCFQTNIQGEITPPDLDPALNGGGRQGLVESNRVMSRLGTVFTTMPVTRGPVGVLYSMADQIDEQSKDPQALTYAHASPNGQGVAYTYLACKYLHQGFQVVLDEDVQDGTLQANYKAIILPGITYLDPAVRAGLEQFIATGGTIILTAESTVDIKGALKLTTPYKHDTLDKNPQSATMAMWQEAVAATSKELAAALSKAGIKPVVDCDNPQVITTRHAAGEIEYLFAVNSTIDEKVGRIGLKESATNITFPADGWSTYDAIRGGAVAEMKAAAGKAAFRFGPGQMRAFARTARPIGGVQVATPLVTRDLSAAANPLRFTINATLVDTKNAVLSGSAPLEILVYDAKGAQRFDLFRATTAGTCSVTLPLAANDPAGAWKVMVRDLLANTEGTASFTYTPSASCGAAMGAAPRALFLADDREKVYRFFRMHKDVIIAMGNNPAYEKTAQRLAESLKPWGVKCTIAHAADMSKPRVLTPEEAISWTGLSAEGQGSPWNAGFNFQADTILLGTPADNPLINFLQDAKVLPYPTSREVIGRGHGMIAWTTDMLTEGYESIALIANDDAGMQEAVGTMYELAAGLTPVTPLALPTASAVTPAMPPAATATLATVWRALAPDRVIGLSADAAGNITAISNDGSVLTISAKGAVTNAKVLPRADALTQAKAIGLPDAIAPADQAIAQKLPVGLMPKAVVAAGDMKAVAYWGGRLVLANVDGAVKYQQQLPQDITALTMSNGVLLAGLADGQILALPLK